MVRYIQAYLAFARARQAWLDKLAWAKAQGKPGVPRSPEVLAALREVSTVHTDASMALARAERDAIDPPEARMRRSFQARVTAVLHHLADLTAQTDATTAAVCLILDVTPEQLAELGGLPVTE